MTSNLPVTDAGSATTHQATAIDSNPFPGPAVTGVCLIAAPVLAIVGTALGIPAYHAKGTDFVHGMVEHSTLFNVAAQAALAGMVTLVLGVAGLANLITSRQPRRGRVAGVLTIVGLCGPISFESAYWAAWHLTDTPAHRAAAAIMLDESQMIPRTIMNVTGPALVIGFVLLGIAAARSRVLDRPRAICLGLTAIIPAGFISGFLVISLVGFVALAIALVPLGVGLVRRDRASAARS